MQLPVNEAVRLTPLGNHSGMDITVQNQESSEYVYLGAEGVNSEDFGYRLAPGAAFSIELPGTDALYAISVNNAYISVLQTNLESGE